MLHRDDAEDMDRDTSDDEDRDAPQDIDVDREFEDDFGYIDCPGCGRTLDEDAPRCPECGYWITEESLAAERSQGWFWPVLVAVLVAIIVLIWSRV